MNVVSDINASHFAQGTVGWHRERRGRITGSKIGTIMKSGKSKNEFFSATAKTYLYQLAGERILNPSIVDDDEMFGFFVDQTSTSSKAMRFGSEQEEHARALYCEARGVEVEEIGLCFHPNAPFASSPDGIFVENGNLMCLEIKCPNLSTFTQYVAEVSDNDSLKRCNPDYYYQCQAHMSCTNAKACDFVVFSPFSSTPLHIVRIQRDDAEISAMIERSIVAEETIKQIVTQLNNA